MHFSRKLFRTVSGVKNFAGSIHYKHESKVKKGCLLSRTRPDVHTPKVGFEKRIVGRVRSAFAKQNTQTRLTPTTKLVRKTAGMSST